MGNVLLEVVDNRPDGREPAQNDPLAETSFRLTLGLISGKVAPATNDIPRFRPAPRPATGGLCCFWASVSQQNDKARRGNRAAWVLSVNLSVIRVEPNFRADRGSAGNPQINRCSRRFVRSKTTVFISPFNQIHALVAGQMEAAWEKSNVIRNRYREQAK
jgi:hypothetical protein